MADLKIYVIGSAPDCDIVVNDPRVSGHHCKLTYDRGGYLIEDLQSTNGTYINGVRISEEMIITKGEQITLGKTLAMPWPNGREGQEVLETRDGTTPVPRPILTPPAPRAPAPPSPVAEKPAPPVPAEKPLAKKPTPPLAPVLPPIPEPPPVPAPTAAKRDTPAENVVTEATMDSSRQPVPKPLPSPTPVPSPKPTGSRTLGPGDMTVGDDAELPESPSIRDPRPAEPSAKPPKSSPAVKVSRPVKSSPPVKASPSAKPPTPVEEMPTLEPPSPKESPKPSPKPVPPPKGSPSKGTKPKGTGGAPPPPSPPRPGARFTDPRALDPNAGSGTRNLVIAAIAAVAIVGAILGFVFFGPDGTPTVPKDPTDPGTSGADSVDPGTKPGGTDSTTGDPAEARPEPKFDPEEAVVWIGYRIGSSEYRHATGFAISRTQVVSAGWHTSWLNAALEDSELTMLVGDGSRTTTVKKVDVLPVEGDQYGLLRIEIEPFENGPQPVDPATIGAPPKPGTSIQWITWSRWEGDAIPFRQKALFREAVHKGVSWKFEFPDSKTSLSSKSAGSPIVIGKRVVGILTLAVDGNPLVLTLDPVIEK